MTWQLLEETAGSLGVGSLDELCDRLRGLRVSAGSPSYTEIARRVSWLRVARGVPEAECKPGRVTIYDCFKPGRRRLDVELLVEIAEALGAAEPGRWRQAYGLVSGESRTAAIVTAADRLPAKLAEFSGRHAELTDILAAAVPGAGGRCLVVSVEGMAGVGKTQLAIQAGHALRRHCADLQLFVNLRGYALDEAPAHPRMVLGSFLRLLGVRGQRFQHLSLDARSALYRRILRNRRALIVLDNAADEDQIRPLLPGDSPSVVLITSRHRLIGLSDAVHIPLGVFSRNEALQYLRRVVGAERVDAEPAAAVELIQLCGYLPLGLELTAAELLRRPQWSLADHVRRLERLPRDDFVRSVLAASYRSLAAPVQRLFRLLALHPGHERVESAAAAALAGLGVDRSDDLLEHLHSEHLLQRTAPDHYQFHDLVRAYAEWLVHREDPRSEQRAALTQLLDYYVRTASAAMAAVVPGARARCSNDRAPRIASGHVSATRFTDPQAAISWLEAERANLVSASLYAAENGWSAHASQLTNVLASYLEPAGL